MNTSFFQSITDPVEAVKVLGPAIAKSQLFACQNEEQGMVIALTCLIEGRSPHQLSQRYDLMFGKMRLKSSAALADFKKLGGKVHWVTEPHDAKRAEARFVLGDQQLRYTFTIEQAQQQGLTQRSEQWKIRPANMLRARVISGALGMIAPEVFAGEDDEQLLPDSEPAKLNLEQGNEATPGQGSSSPTPASPDPKSEPQPSARTADADADANPTAAAAVPTPEPVEDEKELAEQGLAPVQTEGKEDAAPVQETLSTVGPVQEMIARIVEAGVGDAAYSWMLKQNWLKRNETFDTVSEGNARKVLNKFDRFVEAISR